MNLKERNQKIKEIPYLLNNILLPYDENSPEKSAIKGFLDYFNAELEFCDKKFYCISYPDKELNDNQINHIYKFLSFFPCATFECGEIRKDLC